MAEASPRAGRGGRPADVVDVALDDALAQPGCPICRLVERATERYFDGLLWEQVNDPGVRQGLRESLGFCPRHTWELARAEQTRTHNVLGLAILLHDTVSELARALEALMAGRLDRRPRRVRRTRPGLARYPTACPACRQAAQAQADYLARLMQREGQGLLDGGRLCLEHLGLALTLQGPLARPRPPAAVDRPAASRSPRLPASRVVAPELAGVSLAAAAGEAEACGVCQGLVRAAQEPGEAADGAAEPAGRGATLCTAHAAASPGASVWRDLAERAAAAGKVYTLRCWRCEQEAALQQRLLEGSSGALCLPHLAMRLRSPGDDAALGAAVRATAARAAELAGRLAGFIRKQDWHVREPLSAPERSAVPAALLFLAGARVVRP